MGFLRTLEGLVMGSASHIEFGEPDPWPKDVFVRACELMWPESRYEHLGLSSRDIVFILKKEYGRRAYFICDILYPPEKVREGELD